MAKTNYTKVEEALAEGMRKIEVNRLLDIADEHAAANSGKIPPPSQNVTPKGNTVYLKRLAAVYHDIKLLEKTGVDPYVQLKIDKEELKKFVKDPKVLTSEDWDKVKIWKEHLADYKAELEKQKPGSSNDDLVTQQRKKQITKRFNINEKWIPLR